MTWRWPWDRHAPAHLGEGAAAALAAAEGLEHEQERAKQVRQVSESLRKHRERNHFAEMLTESMHVAPDVPPRRFKAARHRRREA